MEPVNGMLNDRVSYSVAEHADEPATGADLSDQCPEPFEATIVRLDQTTAEELFRLASR